MGTGRSGKIWGRRPYAGKEAREQLNDVSRWIARVRPDDVDDPDDPSLSEVVNFVPAATEADMGPKCRTLSDLMSDGLSYRESVCWYWFRYCEFDITEIHYATEGRDQGGDPAQRRNATRNILGALKAAATQREGEDPGAVPDLIDDRKRHDRTDDI